MAPGVISDCVSLGDHAPDKFRVSLAVVVGHEEHRADVLLFQRIENISGAAVLVALVEREPQPLFLASADELTAHAAILLLRPYCTERPVIAVGLDAHSVRDLGVVEAFVPRVFRQRRSRSHRRGKHY